MATVHVRPVTTRAQPQVSAPLIPVVSADVVWAVAGQMLLASYWVAALEVFGRSAVWGAACLIGSALLTFAAIKVSTDEPQAVPTRRSALLTAAAALIVAAWLLPYPMNVPLFLIAAGALFRLVTRYLRVGDRASLAFMALGLTAACQGLATIPIGYVWLRLRYWPGFAQLAQALFSLLGYPASVSGSTLFVMTERQLLNVRASFENLGLFQLGLGLAGTLSWILLLRRRRSALARLAAACLVFTAWRFLLLIAVLAQTQRADWFWDPLVNAALLLGFGVCAARLMPQRTLRVPVALETVPESAVSRKGPVFRTVVLAFSVAGAIWCLFAADPGSRKPGRVLVDESHSGWERTQKSYDTQWYGEMSNYNYATMYQHLGHYYDMKRNEDKPIDRELLSDCDVLILKTPTPTYDRREVEAIRSFVDRGGGVFMIGDHTNVFGMTTYLNQVASAFDFKFNYDATYELSQGTLQQYLPPAVLRHPSLVNLPSQFLFGTSCSIRPSVRDTVTIKGYAVRGLYLDYSRRSFFPEGHLDAKMEYGWMAQGVARAVGRGRIAAFTDSTIFSNFWYFVPGKNELFLGTVEWLNRENTEWLWVFRVLAAAFAFAAVYAGFSLASRLPWIFFAALSAGAAVGVVGADALNKHFHRPPEAITPPVVIAFDRDYSAFNIPAYSLPGGPRSYLTFYTTVQRRAWSRPHLDGFSVISPAPRSFSRCIPVNPCRRVPDPTWTRG